MGLARLNTLVMNDILPFNFGMDYDSWVQLYNEQPTLREFIGDPSTWTAEKIAVVNKQAEEEIKLYEMLMSLPQEEFRNEVERLRGVHQGLTPL